MDRLKSTLFISLLPTHQHTHHTINLQITVILSRAHRLRRHEKRKHKQKKNKRESDFHDANFIFIVNMMIRQSYTSWQARRRRRSLRCCFHQRHRRCYLYAYSRHRRRATYHVSSFFFLFSLVSVYFTHCFCQHPCHTIEPIDL